MLLHTHFPWASLERGQAQWVLLRTSSSGLDMKVDIGDHKGNALGSLRLPYLRFMAIELHGSWRFKWPILALGTVHAYDTHTLDGHHQDGGLEGFNEDIVGRLGPETNVATYASLLKHCTTAKALAEGERVHEHMTRRGYTGNRFLSNLLIQMYSKCGSLEYARAVFNKILSRNLYSWTIMIASCAQHGHGMEAVQLFGQMQAAGFEPDNITFICVLDACAIEADLEIGQDIHASIAGNGWESDVVVGTALVNMYGKCGSLDNAGAVFADMPLWDVVSWNAMLAAYAQNAHGEEALQWFGQMQAEGFEPNKITFICILDACASVTTLERGREIHAAIAGNLGESDIVVLNALVNMYGKCRSLDDARAMFLEMPLRTLVSWSTMMSACFHNGHDKEALQLFVQMHAEGFEPDKLTFVCILGVCSNVAALEEGYKIHAALACKGWESDVVVGTALVDVYGKCGSLEDARAVLTEMPLRNMVSWNALMAACTQNRHGKEALQLLGQMQAEGFEPDKITMISVLDVCASMAVLEEGQGIHITVASHGWEADVVVGTALINMYGSCRSMADARAVFTEMPMWNVVSWSAMMAACTQNGHGMEALQLFDQLQRGGSEPDLVTFVCVLDACATEAAIREGRETHDSIVANGWESDVVAGTALVNMYGKCGSLDDARAVFAGKSLRDVFAWNALTAVCAQNGHGKEVLLLFGQMQAIGVKPDKITFINVLTACSHAGLVADGRECFMSMSKQHGMIPSVEHYVCMVDLLGRQGLLEEAEDLIISMPCEYVALAWLSLLSSCRIHSDVERAVRASEFVSELDPRNASLYVLLADIHASTA